MVVLTLVKEFRQDMPRLGTRKLYYLLAPKLQEHGIKIGRDQLFDLLRFHGLLIRRRKYIPKTTDSHHWMKKYPNLTIGLVVDRPNQLWISDITYIRLINGFDYLSMVTDAYSRKIIGYCLFTTLEAEGCISALAMAISSRGKVPKAYKTIHHSDRGSQYCSDEYTKMLDDAHIDISTTQSGSPYENAMAERVNGTVKNEFNPKVIYNSHAKAKRAIEKIIDIYNSKRPHLSLGYKTPNEVHVIGGTIVKTWKNYHSKNKGNNDTLSI